MAALYKTFFLAFVLVAAAARAYEVADVVEFQQLKAEVFGPNGDQFYGESLEKNHDRMLELLEADKVPYEVQGKITVEFMHYIDTVCKVSDAPDLDRNMFILIQLAKVTKSPKFDKYMWDCFYDRLEQCAPDIYKKTSEKLSSLNESDWNILDKVVQVIYDNVSQVISRVSRDKFNYSKTLVEALKKDSSIKVADVHRICATFLENIDPKLDLYPYKVFLTRPSEPMEHLSQWRSYKDNCQIIMEEWDDIVN